MPELEVVVIGRSGQIALGAEVAVIPAQPLIFSVSGHRTRRLMMDGREHRLSSGSVGLLAADLSRSTGYHRLEIDGQTLWFATEDRKLSLDGITRMLEDLRSIGTGWAGQVIYSDGTGYRDPHVLYGWLDDHADGVMSAIEKILLSPRSGKVTSRRLSRRGGGAVLTVPTLRFLRSAPTQHLVQRDQGILAVGGSRYDPQRVVVRHRQTTVDIVPNSRAVQVLDVLAQIIREVLQSPQDTASYTRLRLWLYRAEVLQQRPLARTLRSGPNVMARAREGVEFLEVPYQTTFAACRDLRQGFGWDPREDRSKRYSYVVYADQIYQAYAVSRLANALGLTQTSTVLGAQAPAFSGSDFDLYYDTAPPDTVLRSWRASTTVPDASRPDALLVERATGRVAVFDAKYRLADDGWATEDSRKEIAAYTSLYGLDQVGVLFPGDSAHVRTIAAHGQHILEVPVSPDTDAIDHAVAAIRGLLGQGRY